MRPLLLAALLALPLAAQQPARPLRILFLGNSYTYHHNLPEIVQAFVNATPGLPKIEARSVTRGGSTLDDLYRLTPALDALRAGPWDYVVIQEHSLLGFNSYNGDQVIQSPDAFHNSVRQWTREIRAAGARPILFATWAREKRPEFQPYLDWAYAEAARLHDAILIPAGTAFQRTLKEESSIKLYQPDGAHPSQAGSYLAACVFVHTLFGKGCAGATNAPTGTPVDNSNGRLQTGQTAPLVNLSQQTSQKLQLVATSTPFVPPTAKPAYAAAAVPAPLPAKAPPSIWSGTWTGITNLYGRPAQIELELKMKDDNTCTGEWRIDAKNPETKSRLPLANCKTDGFTLTFQFQTLFLTTERHEATLNNGNLTGATRIDSRTQYQTQSGAWLLRRKSS